jgi:chemotaxis protein histidine kinase CheA
MGYVIRDSRSKANFDFGVPKRIVYSAESEIDEPVETVIEQEEEVIPEEAQGQSTEQAPVDEDVCRDSQGRPIDCSEASNEDGEEELDPVEQEEAAKQEAIANQEEEDDDVWMDGAECAPDMDNQCGPGMYCSFETSTCVSDENQEEEQAAYDEKVREENEEAQARADQEAAEAKAKADQEAADAKAKADQEAANKKKTTKPASKSGGGGGGGGRGPYMSKNDKLWKKKLSTKSKKTTTKVETKKSSIGIRMVGTVIALGSAYGAYKIVNK